MTTSDPTSVQADEDATTPALWGASTQAVSEMFRVSGQTMPHRFLSALALIKLAAATANERLGRLGRLEAAAIREAAQEVIAGDHWGQFPIDIYQTGSGTSSNMNMNEVLSALSERRRPSVAIHARDHVNLGQSSNDVVPTAMQLCAAVAMQELLRPALVELRDVLSEKSRELWPVIKLARTHLQDASPIRLGQELLGYQGQAERSLELLDRAVATLLAVPLGGTAVGTGINTHEAFAGHACRVLAEHIGLPVRETSNHFAAQSTLDAMIGAHADVRTIALSMGKIGSDIRLLSSGPRAGLGELELPDSAVRSSIMPGKTPPAIVESLTMVVARVVGNDSTIVFAQNGSILELNVMMPVVISSALESIQLLAAAINNFARHCIEGLRATAQGPANVERGLMLATAFTPIIGYDIAERLVAEAVRTGETVREVAPRFGLSQQQIDQTLDLDMMTRPLGGQISPGGEGTAPPAAVREVAP